MGSRPWTLLAVLVIGWMVPASGALGQNGRPSLLVHLERERIYAGESVLYQVELRNIRQPQAPDLGGFAGGFDVIPQGDQSLDRHMVSIMNGRRSEENYFGHVYRYLLRPKRAGTLTVPAITLEVEGETLHGRALTLEVVEPEQQDFVVLDIGADPPSVYPTQPFTVVLRLFVHVLPASLRGATTVRNPVNRGLVRRPPPVPALSIPWVDIPEGLDSEETNKWLSRELSRDPDVGFSINEVHSRGGVFSFFDERLAAFGLGGRPARPEDVADIPALRGRAAEYWVYRLERRFVPQRPGSFRFGPVSLKGDLVDGFDGDRLSWRSIYAVGKAAHLTVKAVPEEGKPASFTGGVGSFEIQADLRPLRCHVGDPLTLTLTVTGEGNLDELGPLDLSSVEGLEEGFRVYEATAETQGSARVFTYSLRPRTAELRELPRLAFSYFDVQRERYVTKYTDPVPIAVEEAARLDEKEILSAPREPENRSKLEAAKGLFGIISDPRRVRGESAPLAATAIYLGGLVVAYLLFSLLLGRWRRLRRDPLQQRRRRAVGSARERLREARESVKSSDTQGAAAAVRRALCGFAADLGGLAEGGMTRREVIEILEAGGLDPDLVRRAGELIDACEAVRFGAPSGAFEPVVDSAGELLDRVAAHCRRKGLLR